VTFDLVENQAADWKREDERLDGNNSSSNRDYDDDDDDDDVTMTEDSTRDSSSVYQSYQSWPLYYQLSEEARAMLLPHPSFHPNEFFYAQQQQQQQSFGGEQYEGEQWVDGDGEYYDEEQEGYDVEEEEVDDEDTEEPEFELSAEMIERFVKTEMRRKQRKEDEKRMAEEKEEQERRRQEALILTPEQKKQMYGEERYKELKSLEDQLQSTFDRRRNELRPAYWPELPLS